jgi:hypothetical protein
VDGEDISRTIVSYQIQDTIQNACLPHKAAFLSVYLKRFTARNRDVYYGGDLPKAELSYWYHRIYDLPVKNLLKDIPELSPSYLKGQRRIWENPFPIEVTNKEDFKRSLRTVYETYDVYEKVSPKFEEYSDSLWNSLESMRGLLKLVGGKLDHLYCKEIMIGKHPTHGYPVLLTFKKPLKEIEKIVVILDWFENVDPNIKEEWNLFEDIKLKIKSEKSLGQPLYCKEHGFVKHNLNENPNKHETADYLIQRMGLVLPIDFSTNKHFYDGLKRLLLTDEDRWFSSIYALLLIAAKDEDCANIETMKNVVCVEDTKCPRITEDGLKHLYNFFIHIVKNTDSGGDAVSKCILSENSFKIELKDKFMRKVLNNTMKILLHKADNERHDTSKPLADFIKACGWGLSICNPSEENCYIFNHDNDNGVLSIWIENNNSYIGFSR